MGLTDAQKGLVRQSWGKIDQEKHGAIFYKKLFASHQDYQQKFSKLRGKDVNAMVKNGDPAMMSQAKVTYAAIGKVVQNLDNPAALDTLLKEIGKRHVNYGAGKTEFDAVRPVLLDALTDALGGMDTSLQAAWQAVIELITETCVAGQ